MVYRCNIFSQNLHSLFVHGFHRFGFVARIDLGICSDIHMISTKSDKFFYRLRAFEVRRGNLYHLLSTCKDNFQLNFTLYFSFHGPILYLYLQNSACQVQIIIRTMGKGKISVRLFILSYPIFVNSRKRINIMDLKYFHLWWRYFILLHDWH